MTKAAALGFLISQGGTWLATGAPGKGWAGGLTVILAMVSLVVFLCIKAKYEILFHQKSIESGRNVQKTKQNMRKNDKIAK